MDLGELATFSCQISGNPVPTGNWYKGAKKIPDEGRFIVETTEDSCLLEIDDVKPEDAGEYKCVVKNDFGEDSCTVKLSVKGNATFLSRIPCHTTPVP